MVASPMLLRNVSRLKRQNPQPIAFIDLKAQQRRIRAKLDAAMARVLDHGQYIMGPEVGQLEKRLEGYCGARHAIGCASGTDALLMALLALGVRSGDAVLCPAFTFTATPETIALIGATPVFVDVLDDSFNIDPEGIEGGLQSARAAGLRPVGILAVDLFGQAADYAALDACAEANRLWVLADAAQSFGATYHGRRTGRLGRITATSFFPAKPLGCYGDGGAVFTENDALADVLRSIRAHGQGVDRYDVARLGINGRLDTLQAAVLIEKLAIFDEEIGMRQAVAARYNTGFQSCAGVPEVPEGDQSVWAQYTLRVEARQRADLVAALQSKGIPTQIYYSRPLHHQPAYRHLPIAAGGLPVSERLPHEVLSLPMHPYLTSDVQDFIIDEVVRALT